MAWVDEANWPEAWTYIYFSPMVKSGSDYIVYAGGYNVQKFYKYNITTNVWTELATPPGVIYGAISMSPDGTKLAAHAASGNVLFIYDISGNSWSTSSVAPNMTDGYTPQIWATVWALNDTVWCQVRGYTGVPGVYWVKCYRYVVSTDTWTQFTNYLDDPSINSGFSMSINTAGTALFVGNIGANNYSGLKYVIATDTYSTFSITSGWRFRGTIDRAAKLWIRHILTPGTLGTRYWDCDTEAWGDIIFPHDSEQAKTTWLTSGIYGTSYIIAHHKLSEPKNRSYRTITAPSVTTNPATEVT